MLVGALAAQIDGGAIMATGRSILDSWISEMKATYLHIYPCGVKWWIHGPATRVGGKVLPDMVVRRIEGPWWIKGNLK